MAVDNSWIELQKISGGLRGLAGSVERLAKARPGLPQDISDCAATLNDLAKKIGDYADARRIAGAKSPQVNTASVPPARKAAGDILAGEILR